MGTTKILVVDDDELLREFLVDALSNMGYEAIAADSGGDAMRKFTPHTFDLVISDLVMPEISGLDLLEYVMSQDQNALFFLVTGYPTSETAVQAIQNGAYDYIVKPFNVDDLKIKIERALDTRRIKNHLKKANGLLWALIISVPIWIILGIVFGLVWRKG